MEYLVTDKPHPRGEIVVRGHNIMVGYYKQPELTATVLHDGWFSTGDVGQINTDGSLSLIDRRKNIFKLAQGEYVAIEVVENVYSRNPFVGMIFGYGDSHKRFLVAVVVPDGDHLKAHAARQGYPDADDVGALCQQERVVRDVLESLQATGRAGHLRGFEVLRGVYLEPEPFSVDNGLLTPSFKLVRHRARQAYQSQIDEIYGQADSTNPN